MRQEKRQSFGDNKAVVVEESKGPHSIIEESIGSAADEAKQVKALKSREDAAGDMLGIDFFDQLVAKYFQLDFPGYDAMWSDDRIPLRNGEQVFISRHYFYKNILMDILEKDEISEEEILQLKVNVETLGYLYTWVFKEEKVNLKVIFEERMNAKSDFKPNLIELKQQGIESLAV